MNEEYNTSEETCLERIVPIQGKPVTVFLVNGVKLSGVIVEVLADGFALARDGVTQLVFQQAVATVMPQDGNTTVSHADHY